MGIRIAELTQPIRTISDETLEKNFCQNYGTKFFFGDTAFTSHEVHPLEEASGAVSHTLKLAKKTNYGTNLWKV